MRDKEKSHWRGILRDRLCGWVSQRLPKRLVYWCAIRLFVHATTGEYSNQVVPDLNAMDALKRWETA